MSAKYRATRVTTQRGQITIYASPRIHDALKEVTGSLTLYKGVRLAQVIEAAYIQGKKDGARAAFEAVEKSMSSAHKLVPHGKPGRPRAA